MMFYSCWEFESLWRENKNVVACSYRRFARMFQFREALLSVKRKLFLASLVPTGWILYTFILFWFVNSIGHSLNPKLRSNRLRFIWKSKPVGKSMFCFVQGVQLIKHPHNFPPPWPSLGILPIRLGSKCDFRAVTASIQYTWHIFNFSIKIQFVQFILPTIRLMNLSYVLGYIFFIHSSIQIQS